MLETNQQANHQLKYDNTINQNYRPELEQNDNEVEPQQQQKKLESKVKS